MTASRGRLDHVVDAARNQCGPQADVEQILGYLQSEGLAIIDAIKAVMQLRGIGLGEAKRLVHFSQAYADQRAAHEASHDELAEALSPARLADHDLREAIEHAYTVFGHHRLPNTIEFCDHCVSAEENSILMSVPLRALTGGQLQRYASKAMTTWGDQADFQHFLPRLLDLLVHGRFEDNLTLPQSLVRKVSCYSTGWSSDERNAISAVFLAWWQNTLANYPAVHDAATVLDALSETGTDAKTYLAAWEHDPSQPAARHLADLLDDWMMTASTDDPWCQTVDHWITSTTPGDVLETATLAASTPEIATRLSNAFESAVAVRRRSMPPRVCETGQRCRQ